MARTSHTADELRDLIAAPSAVGTPPTSLPYGSAAALPAGTPADRETELAVAATQREILACYNTGEGLRTSSLYSAEFVRRIVRDNTARGVNLRRLCGGARRETRRHRANWRGIVEVRDATVLADGRVVARFVVGYQSDPRATETDVVFFVYERGRWRVDGFEIVDIAIPDDPTSTPPAD